MVIRVHWTPFDFISSDLWIYNQLPFDWFRSNWIMLLNSMFIIIRENLCFSSLMILLLFQTNNDTGNLPIGSNICLINVKASFEASRGWNYFPLVYICSYGVLCFQLICFSFLFVLISNSILNVREWIYMTFIRVSSVVKSFLIYWIWRYLLLFVLFFFFSILNFQFSCE